MPRLPHGSVKIVHTVDARAHRDLVANLGAGRARAFTRRVRTVAGGADRTLGTDGLRRRSTEVRAAPSVSEEERRRSHDDHHDDHEAH